eukprot:scaffold106367_cov22-Prasinocladus_malaysianus.AAC.1
MGSNDNRHESSVQPTISLIGLSIYACSSGSSLSARSSQRAAAGGRAASHWRGISGQRDAPSSSVSEPN